MTREKEQRLERDANRLKALGEWETLNKHIVLAMAVDVCQPVNMPPLTARLPAVDDTRIQLSIESWESRNTLFPYFGLGRIST